MSAGSMSQSVGLPREMLEALGAYKEALKDVKTELKDREREAKSIEKKGGVVSASKQERIESLRGTRNRLEQRMAAQKEQKAASRRLGYQKSQLMRAATSPFGTLREVGVEAALKTRGGRRAVDIATRGGAAISKALGTAAVGLPVGAIAGLIGGGSIGAQVAVRQSQLLRDQALGNLQVAEASANVLGGAAIGGALSRDAGKIMERAFNARVNRAEGIAEGTISGAIEKALLGRSAQQNSIGTKAALVELRRQQRIKQFGAGYADNTDRNKIKRTRATQIRDTYLQERGALATFFTMNVYGGTEVVDPTAWLWNKVTWGAVDARGVAMENAILSAQEREDKVWDETRKAQMNQFNTAVGFAKHRALANERANAVRAYEDDKLMRGVTWRLQ